MLQINFYPDSDDPKFKKAAKEYKQIWRKDGKRIKQAIEKISGLKFKEKVINAITYGEISYSNPLQLQSNISNEHKKGTLVHELCHRLVLGNKIKTPTSKSYYNTTLKFHKQNSLILYDIWIELYKEDFAKKEIAYEISLWTEKSISPYKIAWDWALSKTKEERKAEFGKYKK